MALALTEFSARDTLMHTAADGLAAALRDAISKHGSACAALSGGSTPEPAYRELAAMPLDWSKITFALVDERFVQPTHSASNEAMLRRALAPALAAGAQLLPMYENTASLDQAADAAEARYAPVRIDIALMGMGSDGHTASWFSGADRLGEALDLDNPRTVIGLSATQADGSSERLTLTRAAVSRAGHVVMLITGQDKRTRLEAALAGDWAPVAALFTPAMRPPEVLWTP